MYATCYVVGHIYPVDALRFIRSISVISGWFLKTQDWQRLVRPEYFFVFFKFFFPSVSMDGAPNQNQVDLGVQAGGANPGIQIQAPPAPAAAFAHIPVPKIPPFQELEGKPPLEFRKWFISFEGMLHMLDLRTGGILPDVSKNWTLFTHLGVAGQGIISNVPAQEQINQMTYPAYSDFVRNTFAPRQSTVKAWADLENRRQRPGEQVDSFFSELQSLFASTTLPQGIPIDILRPYILMMRLVLGCNDNDARQELLCREALTLDATLQYLRARETSKSEATALSQASGEVMKVQHPPPKDKNAPPRAPPPRYPSPFRCLGCGSTAHGFKDRAAKCPAYNKECFNCGRMGHFSSVCQSKSSSPRGKARDKSSGQQDTRPPKAKRLTSDPHPSDPILIHVRLGPDSLHLQSLALEADSAAEVSLLSVSSAKNIFGNNISFSPAVINNYDGSAVSGVVGSLPATVEFRGRQHSDKIYIVQDGHPEILGKNYLIPLSVSIQCGTASVCKTSVDSNSLFSAFPGLVSEDLGTFKGPAHCIKLKPDAVPHAVRVRPIPLCYREAAEKEILLMDRLGIWEKVKQSEWVHPLVVVGKPEQGQVRITTDLSRLNKSVVPERHPIPHIKDLFLQLQGATVFSKLDLRKGYFHIPLHPDCRHLTTTATPLGLRQYCRLPMGLTDSASVFQRSISQALAGLPGVAVYIDDIIIYGENDAVHDKRLENVLRRLHERGFHLQPSKCILKKKEIPAFGHIISKDGIKPHPKNLQPLLEFPVPKSVSEVQSFLGLINFFGDFLPRLAHIAEPLRELTRKGVPFQWSPACQESFQTLKDQASAAQILHIF